MIGHLPRLACRPANSPKLSWTQCPAVVVARIAPLKVLRPSAVQPAAREPAKRQSSPSSRSLEGAHPSPLFSRDLALAPRDQFSSRLGRIIIAQPRRFTL